MDGGRPIATGGVRYDNGISGQPGENGEWSWLIYDLRAEMQRLGIDSMPDSVSGWMGYQDSSAAVDLYVKTSDNMACPDTAAWKSTGSGVSQRARTSGSGYHFKVALDGDRWLFLGMRCSGSGEERYGVWGDIKLWTDIPTRTEMALFHVAGDSLDTAGMDFTHRNAHSWWRHDRAESDGGLDSAEGIGTEDLVSGYWNRYKGSYRVRGALARAAIDGRSYGFSDTVTRYFGITDDERLLPAEMKHGHSPWVEDRSTDTSNAAIMIDSVVYDKGVGGAPPPARWGWTWVLYDLQAEAERLQLGTPLALSGIVARQDGSIPLDAYVKTSNADERPSMFDWQFDRGSVVEQVHLRPWFNKQTFSITSGVGDIKWVWLGVRLRKGDSTDAHVVFADLALRTRARDVRRTVLSTDQLSQSVAGALERAAGGGTADPSPRLTLLATLLDFGYAQLYSSEWPRTNHTPRLELTFSDSRTLLSWRGDSPALDLPENGEMTLVGNPSLGDGRFDRVLRYHESGQAAMIDDNETIDYTRGRISFWFRKSLPGGDAADAVLFERTGSDTSRFALVRPGSAVELLLYGDSTDANVMRWSFIDSFLTVTDGGDTTWGYDTLPYPFDGDQHEVVFAWDAAVGTFDLTVDGARSHVRRRLTYVSNAANWPEAELRFGRNSDGFVEHLAIRSMPALAAAVNVPHSRVEPVPGYLPYVQPGFRDTVDCTVVSPPDPLMRQELDKYAMRNNSIGIRTQVVDFDDIQKYYAGADPQERLRAFLRNAAVRWQSRYVVLGGSVDLIPSRRVAFETRAGLAVTTDRYYACLEGSWNDDGDEYWAEPEDNVDLSAELTVGRFPAMNWRELRAMVDKSSMAMSLPPYGGQALEKTGDVLVSGIRMFNDIGGVTDGEHYGRRLEEILREGGYTARFDNEGLRSYYPVGSDGADPTAEDKLAAFVDTLSPMPGMWIHYGHGASRAILIDTQWVTLDYDKVIEDTAFAHSRRPMHIRVVGCETAAQLQLSMARAFLARPIGGAVSYVGAAEYSYPAVESRILEEELKLMADSSVFTWGDIYRMAADRVLAQNPAWDIARWVVLSRNYLGDPVLPVRVESIGAADSLTVAVTPSTVDAREAEIAVAVTAAGKPVEGAAVGVISRKLRLLDGEGNDVYRGLRDLTYGRGVTDRHGSATMTVRIADDDSLVVSAAHPDYRATRKPLPVVFPAQQLPAVTMRVYDEELEWVNPWPEPYDTLANNYVIEAGDRLRAQFLFLGREGIDNINISQLSVTPDTAGSGIEIVDTLTPQSGHPLGRAWVYEHTRYYSLHACPPGVTDLAFVVSYVDSAGGPDTMRVTVPVAGPSVKPVITFVTDGSGNVDLQILLGNASPGGALGLQCELLCESPYVTITEGTTETVEYAPGGGAADLRWMRYTLNSYDEDYDGIIPARLVVRGLNIAPDTLDIDLNPLSRTSFAVHRPVSVDYRDGVTLSWDPQRYDERGNRRSDFLGFAVTRYRTDNPGEYSLLTPSPVTVANYFHDVLPPDSPEGDYVYQVWLMDSSYNCVQYENVHVRRPWTARVRENFPVFANDIHRNPVAVSDINRDGMAEVVLPSWPAQGFAADGQGAVGGTPMLTEGDEFDGASAQGLSAVFADLDGDGREEGIFAGVNRLVVKNYADDSKSWQTPPLYSLDGLSVHTRWIAFNRSPAIADVDGDGDLDIVAIGQDYDRTADGPFATTVYAFESSGSAIARINLGEGSHAPALAVGDFKHGNGDSLEILAAARCSRSTTVTAPCGRSTMWTAWQALQHATFPASRSARMARCTTPAASRTSRATEYWTW